MTKSPAFQFYPDDFVGGRPGMMTPEEVGVYTLLLCLDWNQNGFKLEKKRLATWCRTTTRKFNRIWDIVGDNFVERDGRMFNPRLELERQKQQEYSETQRHAAAVRWGKLGNANAMPAHMRRVSSPSPSPITTTPTSKPFAHEPAPDSEVPTAVAKPKGNTWLTPYANAWEAQYGGKLSAGPAVKALAPLEKQHGKDETLRRWVIYLASNAGQFASPARFAQTCGEWASARPNGRERDPPRKEKVRDPVSEHYGKLLEQSARNQE